MKPIQVIIIIIFIVSGVLAFLLYQKKANRVNEQLSKKEMGWNPVAIKKMFILKKGTDTLWLIKKDGVWNTNRHFDGMGTAQQLLIYLSTMQIQPSQEVLQNSSTFFEESIQLQSFDKMGAPINHLLIGQNAGEGKCYAIINGNGQLDLLYSNTNKLSIRDLSLSVLALSK